MTFEKADIVTSLNGRDEGKIFIIIESKEGYSYIADGKHRRIDNPKKKNRKHLKLLYKAKGPIVTKILDGDKVTNNELRRALAEFSPTHSEKGGM